MAPSPGRNKHDYSSDYSKLCQVRYRFFLFIYQANQRPDFIHKHLTVKAILSKKLGYQFLVLMPGSEFMSL